MARLFLAPVLLAGLLVVVSNAGAAEAAWWWSGWRWDYLFPNNGRGGGGGYGDHGHGDYGYHGHGGYGNHGHGGYGDYGQGGYGDYGHGGYGDSGRSHVASIVTEDLYRTFFLHKDDTACPARGFYNYTSFLRAADAFPAFGGDGDDATRRREVAAFLAQISHETTGGWATAPDGPFAWGLCFKEEISPPSNYCDANNTQWPCVPGKSYHGRGPIQLSWNYNYGPAGKAVGFDGLREPEKVAADPDVAFKTALWFWMTPRAPKPSCHDVMVGRYTPTGDDLAKNRTAGFGLTTNIINGGIECGPAGKPAPVADRIGFFKRYSGMLGVDVGPNLDCANQQPYS